MVYLSRFPPPIIVYSTPHSTPPIWRRLEAWQRLTQAPSLIIRRPLPRSVPESKKTQCVPPSVYPLELVDPLLTHRFIHPPKRKEKPRIPKTQGVPLSVYPLYLVDPLLPFRFIHPPPRKKIRRILLSISPLGQMDPLLHLFPLQSNAGTIRAVQQILGPCVPLQI